MRVVAILQARMGSTRLPGKVMLPLAGKPMLQNIIERVQRSKLVHEVIVTVPLRDVAEIGRTIPDSTTLLSPWIGDENDLVSRYLSAATSTQADLIVRVPCDNPCVDPAYIDEAVDVYMKCDYIFYSNTTDCVAQLQPNPVWLLVDGVGCEVFSMSRLKWLDRITQGNAERREHPHKYFESVKSDAICISKEGTIRLDVNTQADYDFIASIYNHFGHNRFTAQEILACPPVQERLRGR